MIERVRVSQRVLQEDGARARLRSWGFRYVYKRLDWLGEYWARPPLYAAWLRFWEGARLRYYGLLHWGINRGLWHFDSPVGAEMRLRDLRPLSDPQLWQKHAAAARRMYELGRSDGFDAGYEQGKRTQQALLATTLDEWLESRQLMNDGREGPIIFAATPDWRWHGHL